MGARKKSSSKKAATPSSQKKRSGRTAGVRSGKASGEHQDKLTFKRVWRFLWNDDSLASWLANIVLAFLIIKFIVYPVLSAMFGTSLPLVAVVSCSMEHRFTDCGADAPYELLCSSQGQGTVTDLEYWKHCGEFYEENNISYERFESFPFDDGFNKGDVIFLKGEEPEDISVGDVLVFKAQVENSYPIIHRVVEKRQAADGEFVFETKGDHNAQQINNSRIDEFDIREDDIIGVGVARIPYVGYLKIWFVKFLSLFGLA